MVNVDDIGTAALVGSIPLVIILLVWYFVFSVPKIDECHEKGGVIVRVEGTDKCVEPPKEIK